MMNTFDAKHAPAASVPRHRPEGAPAPDTEGRNAPRPLDAAEEWTRSLG